MDFVSIEIVSKSVEWLAGALGHPREKPVLPKGMKYQRGQPDILVLSLLHRVGHFAREDSRRTGYSGDCGRTQSVRGHIVPRNSDILLNSALAVAH